MDEIDGSRHPTLIDEIESILNSPAEFTSSTPSTTLLPLLDSLHSSSHEFEGDLQESVANIERWCEQLDDACRAAFARDTITTSLNKIESWPEWDWNTNGETIESRRTRIEEIKLALAELPIEWLKRRVTELRKTEGELHPPAYLTIHITFSLLPPLATLSSLLQIYTVRFRVWEISESFFSILSTLKSFITVPSLSFPSVPYSNGTSPNTTTGTPTPISEESEFSKTEILALTFEAGLLLDKMIDISIEQKGDPIPDTWIDEFERVERIVGTIIRYNLDEDPSTGIVDTPSPPHVQESSSAEVVLVESPVLVIKRDGTRSSFGESLFEFSVGSARLDDSMSSIEEDDLPEHLVMVDKPENDLSVRQESISDEGQDERDFNLEDELIRDEKRIFEKEYHAIATPPRDEDQGIDHSPYLQRVIAELEDLGPLEASYGDLQETTDDIEEVETSCELREMSLSPELPRNLSGELDKHGLYNVDDEEDSDSDEYLRHNHIATEIRTSSPIYPDHELNYAELDSDTDSDFDSPSKSRSRYDDTVDLSELDSPITFPASPDTTIRVNPLSLDPFSPPRKPADENTIRLPTSRPSSPRKYANLNSGRDTPSPTPLPSTLVVDPNTPPSLRTSQLHSKVTEIAHSHPTIALIPQESTFRPTSSSEYGMYTLRPKTSMSAHSRHSSVSSSNTASPHWSNTGTGRENGAGGGRRVDVAGVNLYVRILSDRVMVRVGGGWVDLEHYLVEYIGKHRRRSGSTEPNSATSKRNASSSASAYGSSPRMDAYEFLELDDSLMSSAGQRSVSSLGVPYGSPPRGSGRHSSLEMRSVTPEIGNAGANPAGSIGRAAGGGYIRRMYVRRK